MCPRGEIASGSASADVQLRPAKTSDRMPKDLFRSYAFSNILLVLLVFNRLWGGVLSLLASWAQSRRRGRAVCTKDSEHESDWNGRSAMAAQRHGFARMRLDDARRGSRYEEAQPCAQ